MRIAKVPQELMAFLLLTACGGSPAATTTSLPPQTTTTAVAPPVFVPTQCGTATPTSVAVTTTTVPEPATLTLEEQLEVLDGLDNAVVDNYLYTDFNGLDWPAAVAAVAADIETGLTTSQLYERLDALVVSLGDEHSHFEDPAENAAAEQALQGANDYVGIGVLVDPDVDKGHLAILSVYPDSAAAHAGLQPHDRITAVNGAAITIETAAVAHGLRGPACTLVTLTVSTPGAGPRQVAAVRAGVTGGIPIEAQLVPGEDRIGYVMVPTLFDLTIPEQVREALQGFGELDGLILDLRENGGGSGAVFDELLGMFLGGTVGEFVSREGTRTQEIVSEAVANSQTVPLVVLIDVDTESFAEVMAGILSAEGRALLIGETTTGNVETLRAFHLNDGSVAWLAAERFVPAQDPEADWERTGIVPDIEVVSDWVEFTFATDPAIPAAVEELTGG